MKDDTHTGTVASVRSGYESILIQNIGHVCVVVYETRLCVVEN